MREDWNLLYISQGQYNIVPEAYFSIIRNVFDREEGVLRYNDTTYPISLKRYINAGDGRYAGLSLYVSYSLGNLMQLSLNPSYEWYSYKNLSSYYYGINANLSFILGIAMGQISVNYDGPYTTVWGRSDPAILLQLALATRIRNFDITL